MPGLSVTAQIVTTDPPGSAFERLETGQLLELECEQLTVGAAAAISLPVGDGARADPVGMPITLLGYVAGVKRGRSVVIVHHQPWRGRLTIRFFPDGAGPDRSRVQPRSGRHFLACQQARIRSTRTSAFRPTSDRAAGQQIRPGSCIRPGDRNTRIPGRGRNQCRRRHRRRSRRLGDRR